MSWNQRTGLLSIVIRGSATSPVLSRRKRPRARRYSSPERNASAESASARPVAFHAARPSTAQIVEWKDETRAPYSAQQFQAPSSSRRPANDEAAREPSCPKYEATDSTTPLMQGSTSPSK